MGLDDIAKGAALLIGAGIVAERFGAGTGLAGLGTGIRTIAAAPLGGTGAGLGEFATGLDQFATVLSNIGKGIGDIFKAIPRGEGIPYIPFISYPEQNGGYLTPLPEPAPYTPPAPTYVSSGNAGNASNIVMNSSLPYNPASATKGLGRIYQMNGAYGFRKAPSLSFPTRKAARRFLNDYNGFDSNYVMGGTSV